MYSLFGTKWIYCGPMNSMEPTESKEKDDPLMV